MKIRGPCQSPESSIFNHGRIVNRMCSKMNTHSIFDKTDPRMVAISIAFTKLGFFRAKNLCTISSNVWVTTFGPPCIIGQNYSHVKIDRPLHPFLYFGKIILPIVYSLTAGNLLIFNSQVSIYCLQPVYGHNYNYRVST